MVFARKIIQPKATSRKVVSICTVSPTVGSLRSRATISRKFLFLPRNMSGANNRAWYAPQQTKVQFAPCQKPLNRKMIAVLRKVLPFPHREPPSGI